MKRQQNLLELFEDLQAVEPAEGWDEKILARIDQKPDRSGVMRFRAVLIAAGIMLLSADALTVSKHSFVTDQRSRPGGLGDIATEFLISTSSSKY